MQTLSRGQFYNFCELVLDFALRCIAVAGLKVDVVSLTDFQLLRHVIDGDPGILVFDVMNSLK